MKRLLALFLVSGLAVTACADSPEPLAPSQSTRPVFGNTGSGDAYVPGRVLARFKPGAAAAQIATAHGAQIQRPVTLGILMLKVADGNESRVAAALARNPNVEFAEPDFIRTFGDPAVMPVNDPFIGYKWDLDNDGTLYNSTGAFVATTTKPDADMDWKEAYEHLNGAAGSAVIGIMDTGVRADHEELAGRIMAQYDFFAGDGDAADDDGHGTHVAGITAAAANNGKGVSGVAFGNIRFAIAKVCGQIRGGPNGYGCPLSAIAEGITWAVDNGAHVLNLSLGGGSGSAAEQTALQYARSRNVLPFCATGNEATAVSYPAKFPECVAVGATDWGDNMASYSNFGPEVELSAPGGDDEDPNGYSYILSSYFDSPTSYAFMAGTSMATPQAAGLAALLHALGHTDDDAKLALMKSTADDLGPAGRDNQFGYGRINAFRAVSGSTGGGTTNAAPNASFGFTCNELSCSFDGSASSDSDGSVTGYAWSFGDGATASGATASHSYAAGGTYTVTLTVTDDDGATDNATQNVTVATSGGGAALSLSVSAYKVKGVQHADLTWSGASSTNVDVFRNGARVATTANDGAHTDNIGAKGSGTYTYRVCEAGTTTCSNEATATF